MILAIGPQNTYVMRQGALGRHVVTVIAVCSLCDIVLICMGAFGLAQSIANYPTLRAILLWGGMIFIGGYAFKSWRRAIVGGYFEALQTEGKDVTSRGKVILTAMGFSLLNPHAILDTVVVIGGMALRYDTFDDRLMFAVGASLGSITWFIILGNCARMLSSVLRTPTGMRVFDAIVGIIMLWMLYNLWTTAWSEPGVTLINNEFDIIDP
jgi:L-lysine exporter family protein LysE/ArgO